MCGPQKRARTIEITIGSVGNQHAGRVIFHVNVPPSQDSFFRISGIANWQG